MYLEYKGRDGSGHDLWTQSLASIERNYRPKADSSMRSDVGDDGPDKVKDVRPSDRLRERGRLREPSRYRNLDLDRTTDE